MSDTAANRQCASAASCGRLRGQWTFVLPSASSKADFRQRRLLAGPGCARTSAVRQGNANGRFWTKQSGAARPRVDPERSLDVAERPPQRSQSITRPVAWERGWRRCRL